MDEIYIKRCFSLALLGSGYTLSNPMVGSVIIHDGTIIGEGYHQKYGGSHAEVNAINSVRDKELLRSSTIYVNLEPCSHHGKTPPCADLIIQSGIPRVVIAGSDPNPLVAGKGIKKLRDAGIEVIEGILEDEAIQLNRRFYHFHRLKRPYVVLKWAQSEDGFIGQAGKGSVKISSEESRVLVHKWRSEEQAIMIGANTAVNDDPELTVRSWTGHEPLRIILDRSGSVTGVKLLTDNKPALVVSASREEEKGIKKWKNVDEWTALSICDLLYREGISSVMVEGGTKTLNLFLESGLWNEARILVSPNKLSEGIKAPEIDFKQGEELSSGQDRIFIVKNDPI